jgi:hypothetical protein
MLAAESVKKKAQGTKMKPQIPNQVKNRKRATFTEPLKPFRLLPTKKDRLRRQERNFTRYLYHKTAL